MGKASNAKKVARQARERGEVPAKPKRNLRYPLIVAAAVVLGVLIVWYARTPADQPATNIIAPEVQTSDSVPSPADAVDPNATPTTVAPATTVAP